MSKILYWTAIIGMCFFEIYGAWVAILWLMSQMFGQQLEINCYTKAVALLLALTVNVYFSKKIKEGDGKNG